MENDKQLLKYDENIGLYDHINPILNLKDLNRKQVKELAKEIADNKSQTHSWQEVSNDAVNYDSKNKRQEKRFKRIFNKQLNENLAPILEKQHKQELIDRMKSGDPTAMSQWTTEGINKFGYQFMPVMLTAATLPFGFGAFGQAANTMGLLPALGAEAGSWGLGYGGYKLGSKLDDDFGTNWIAPALSVASGIGGYGTGYKGMVKLGSRGWLPKGDKFMYGNQFVGDVVADGLKRGIRTTRLSQPLLEPVMRFKLGDVEINDPNLYYRQGTKEMGDDLIESGVVRGTTPETIKKVYALPGSRIQLTKAFSKPMFNQGKLFFGVKENFPDLIVAGPSAPMFPAHKGGNIVDIRHINSVNVKSRRIPGIQLTSDQVSLYRLDPDYGYRIVKPEVSTIDRVFGIRNRVFTGNPVFQKDNWTIPAFNTNSAYRLTGQSQIDDMIQTGFVRPKAGKIRGGHTNEVHWSIGQPRFGYNGGEGQYVLESPLGLVDETDVALNVKDLSHIWTVRNGQLVDVLNEITPLRELPETAFMSKPNPLDEIRFRLKPSSAEIASIKERDLYQKFLNAINRKDIDDTFNRIIRSQYMDPDLLRSMLKSKGIDEQLLTDKNINRLISARYFDYAHQNQVDKMALRNKYGFTDQLKYNLFRRGDSESIGYIHTSDNLGNIDYGMGHVIPDHINVQFVKNLNPKQYKGVSEQGYNAAIGDLGHVDSGIMLLNPARTTAVQNKYSNKTFLGNFGTSHGQDGLTPVYRLNSPTYEVPVKYIDDFDLNGLSSDGTFVVDFNKGPRYLNGGKLNGK